MRLERERDMEVTPEQKKGHFHVAHPFIGRSRPSRVVNPTGFKIWAGLCKELFGPGFRGNQNLLTKL